MTGPGPAAAHPLRGDPKHVAARPARGGKVTSGPRWTWAKRWNSAAVPPSSTRASPWTTRYSRSPRSSWLVASTESVPVAKGESIDLSRTRSKLLRAATELFYREGPRLASRRSPAAPACRNSLSTATLEARTACSTRSCGSAATRSWPGCRQPPTGPPIPSNGSLQSSTRSTAGTPRRASAAAPSSTPPNRAPRRGPRPAGRSQTPRAPGRRRCGI
jgi:hypothetical protein